MLMALARVDLNNILHGFWSAVNANNNTMKRLTGQYIT